MAEQSWLVEKLIPANQLCFFLAQAGVGKSLLAEALALAILHGEPFGNRKTRQGDVLIVDQDTPSDVLTRRLLRLQAGYSAKPKGRLYVLSMQGYYLHDSTLITLLKDYSHCKLIVVDSLHSVCGKYDSNRTVDMSSLARLKEYALKDNTILFNHHISQKVPASVPELMNGEAGNLAMGNSAIIQQADSYYIIGAEAKDGMTNKIYLRPVSKRVAIPGRPLVLRVLQVGEKAERIEYYSDYVAGIGEVEHDILLLFTEDNHDRTVKEVYEGMGQRHGIGAVRDGLKVLDEKGLITMSRHHHDLFKYHLVEVAQDSVPGTQKAA